MTTYKLVTYDVWGNARDGFEVNAAYYTDVTIDLQGDEPDRTINRRLQARGITWEGERDLCLYGTVKRNGKPVAELRPINRC